MDDLDGLDIIIRKVSLGDVIISYDNILRWRIYKNRDGHHYIGYIREKTFYLGKKPRVYVVTLKVDKLNSYYVLERAKDNNISHLKGIVI